MCSIQCWQRCTTDGVVNSVDICGLPGWTEGQGEQGEAAVRWRATIVKVFVRTCVQGVKEVHRSVFVYMCLINVWL